MSKLAQQIETEADKFCTERTGGTAHRKLVVDAMTIGAILATRDATERLSFERHELAEERRRANLPN